jgi:hypothetical protein
MAARAAIFGKEPGYSFPVSRLIVTWVDLRGLRFAKTDIYEPPALVANFVPKALLSLLVCSPSTRPALS